MNELMRGIRLYFHKLVEGLPALAVAKAQLGLGHSYSRSKVKFNVHRSDNMIIQTISLLDQLDKDINTFSMRIRFCVGVGVWVWVHVGVWVCGCVGACGCVGVWVCGWVVGVWVGVLMGFTFLLAGSLLE